MGEVVLGYGTFTRTVHSRQVSSVVNRARQEVSMPTA